MRKDQDNLLHFPAKLKPGRGFVWECPCGGQGILEYKSYYTDLDDADPDWGGYDVSYGFSLDDPCDTKYEILDYDDMNGEFILRPKE